MSVSRYEGRTPSPELNSLLKTEANSFIAGISQRLNTEFAMRISLAGSLSQGRAIYMTGGGWFIKDVDFLLYRPTGSIYSAEATKLQNTPWFFDTALGFVNGLGQFYTQHEITAGILEVDFIYDISTPNPQAFSIGKNSVRSTMSNM